MKTYTVPLKVLFIYEIISDCSVKIKFPNSEIIFHVEDDAKIVDDKIEIYVDDNLYMCNINRPVLVSGRDLKLYWNYWKETGESEFQLLKLK